MTASASRRVLVVDDDPDFRGLLRPALEEHRLVVTEVATLADADRLRDAHDVVILDGVLPDGDGLTWLEKARSAGMSIPVVFATGAVADQGTLRDVVTRLRVSFVVAKPISPELLAARVAGLAPGPPVPKPKAPANEALARLRERYAERLPDKLRDLLGHADRAAEDPESAAEARLLAHRLHGTAGSFGFPEVSKLAGELEAALTAQPLVGERVASAAKALADYEPAAASLPPRSTRVRPRVLLVAERDEVADAIVAAVRHQLAEPVVVATRDDALNASREGNVAAAVVDARPGVDRAADVVAELRAMPGCAGLTVALVTDAPSVEDRAAAVTAGVELVVDAATATARTWNDLAQQLLVGLAAHDCVCVVDDDPDFRAQISAILSKDGVRVVEIADPSQALDELERAQPDLVLLDVVMQPIGGLELCRMLRATTRWRSLPILVVTVMTETETRVAAFRAGADDYIIKPIIREELQARVSGRLERARLLRSLASEDSLTGLLRRRPFLEAVESRLAEARRKGRTVTVALFDLDHFKRVNDDHGHFTGDRVLAQVGALAGRCFRREDLRCRWGGEEFALAFMGESLEQGEMIMNRFRREVAGQEVVTDEGASLHITLSAGVASFPRDGEDARDLLEVADRRLYRAKEGGRDRVVASD